MLLADEHLSFLYNLHHLQERSNKNITSQHQPHQLHSNIICSSFVDISTSPTNRSTAATLNRRTEVLSATTQLVTATTTIQAIKRCSDLAELRKAVSAKIAFELKIQRKSKCNNNNKKKNIVCCIHNNNYKNSHTHHHNCSSNNKSKKKTVQPDDFMGSVTAKVHAAAA